MRNNGASSVTALTQFRNDFMIFASFHYPSLYLSSINNCARIPARYNRFAFRIRRLHRRGSSHALAVHHVPDIYYLTTH